MKKLSATSSDWEKQRHTLERRREELVMNKKRPKLGLSKITVYILLIPVQMYIHPDYMYLCDLQFKVTFLGDCSLGIRSKKFLNQNNTSQD